MRRGIKWLILALLAAGGFALYSFLGARFTAGRIMGPNPPLTERTMTFAFGGVPELAGRRAWVLEYQRSRLPGVRRAVIYISPTGRLIETRPRDLDVRLDAWERSRLPQ